MSTISAVIIARNAEKLIGDALDSVSFCDEIIVIDNNSSDRTREVARYFKAKVFEAAIADFSELRTLGLKKASGEWILYIDSDERVGDELKKDILRVISSQISLSQNLRGFGGFYVKRKNFYLGNHQWPYVESITRLFRKSALKGWRGQLHESPVVVGEIGEIGGYLLHYTHRDLSSMVTKTIAWSKIEAELRFKGKHPKMSWWRFLRVMATAFFDSYIRQGGWKVGTVGLIESLYQSFSMFITYARLWEIQQKHSK